MTNKLYIKHLLQNKGKSEYCSESFVNLVNFLVEIQVASGYIASITYIFISVFVSEIDNVKIMINNFN